jgi:predicted ATPase/DNA-binding CsgD family transcriptional regulator
VESVRSYFASPTRLVTLTGPGGVGKTRLALEVAQKVNAEFTHGIWFVDLSSIADSRHAVAHLCRVFGAKAQTTESLCESLKGALQSKQLLILLDNCEHVLALASRISSLLDACPNLSILATSRAPLRIRGEQEYQVQPLALPDREQLANLNALRKASSVELLIQRARAVCPAFQLTRGNASAVVELCLRLDGLPLAIELAAPRLRCLSPAELLEGLASPLDIPCEPQRDLAKRQHTLRAAIGWSYALLGCEQQQLFRRLALFEGGFDVRSVDSVCGAAGSVLHDMSVLVEASLVAATQSSQSTRFHLLETMRAFALEELAASGEMNSLRTAHMQHYLSLVEELEPRLSGPDQVASLDALEREHPNIRAALRWALARRDVTVGLRLCSGLRYFWYVRGHLREGSDWLARFLDVAPVGAVEPRLRAQALNAAGNLAGQRGEYDVALRYHQEGLSIRQAIGDDRDVAQSLVNLGSAHIGQANFQAAQGLYEESLRIRRALSDAPGVILSLENLAQLAYVTGDLRRARELYAEGNELSESLGHIRGVGGSLLGLAWIARQEGDVDCALDLCGRAVVLFQKLADQSGLAECLETMGEIALIEDNLRRAARLFGAADTLWERAGSLRMPFQRDRHAHSVGTLHMRLGAPAVDRAWTQGRTMSASRAVAEALTADGSRPHLTPHWPAGGRQPLTRREQEVALLIARGMTNRQIAEALVVSEGTARIHVDHILSKLAFHRRTQIARWVLETGLARNEAA